MFASNIHAIAGSDWSMSGSVGRRRPSAAGTAAAARSGGIAAALRRARPRMFDPGALRLVVLGLIAEEPRHGYDIIKALEAKFQGAYSPSPGAIYPMLQMLEEADLVVSRGRRQQAAAIRSPSRAGPISPSTRRNSPGSMRRSTRSSTEVGGVRSATRCARLR